MRRNDLAITLLAGGVGGARAARALTSQFDNLTVIANVGDDEEIYGMALSPDVDSITYTLAGIEGEHGWGRAGDTFNAMDSLAELGVDTTFRLGDKDLALNLYRTRRLASGAPLSAVTAEVCTELDIAARIIPATDDRVPTVVDTTEHGKLSFQDYFVLRQASPTVESLIFSDAEAATPAPGVLEAIEAADLVVFAPSNPPLSIWPILAIPGIVDRVEQADRVVAISPLIGGRPLKGPTDRVMSSLGYEVSHAGIVDCYDGLLTHLVVDSGPVDREIEVLETDTMVNTPEAGEAFGEWFSGQW